MTEDELIERTAVLPERYADRLPAETVEDLRVYEGAGEPGELISLLIAALAEYQSPVSPAERNELRALAGAMDERGEYVNKLTVQGA